MEISVSFVCPPPPSSQKGEGPQTITETFLVFKNFHMPHLVSFTWLVLELSRYLYGGPSFQRKEGSQTITETIFVLKNFHMPSLVPFAWLVLELCRNLCFICMRAPLPEEGGVSNHNRNISGIQKSSNAKFGSIYLISFRVMWKFMFHLYAPLPILTEGGGV